MCPEGSLKEEGSRCSGVIYQVSRTPLQGFAGESAERASGRAGGGAFIGRPALKEKLIKKLKPMTKNKWAI